MRAFRESEAKDIERSMQEYREVLKTRAKERPQTADSGASGGFGGGSNGGFGGKGQGGGWKRKEKELPAEGNRIMGRGIPGGKTAALREIAPELGTVVLEGVLFRKSERVIKSGNYLVSLLITDNKTTICARRLSARINGRKSTNCSNPMTGVKLRGEVQWDTFENMNTVMFKDLEKTDRAIGREDTWENGRRVELHIHSKMSQMDGFNEAKDIVAMAAKWGQPAVAVTDHGVVRRSRIARRRPKSKVKKVARSRSSTAWRAMCSTTQTACRRTAALITRASRPITSSFWQDAGGAEEYL